MYSRKKKQRNVGDVSELKRVSGGRRELLFPSHSSGFDCYFLTHKPLQHDSHVVTTELHKTARTCSRLRVHTRTQAPKTHLKKKKKPRRRKPAWRLKITGTEPPAARPHTQIRTSAGRNAHLSRRIWHQLVVICFRTSTVVVQGKTQRIHASVEVRRCHFYCLQHQRSSAILYPVSFQLNLLSHLGNQREMRALRRHPQHEKWVNVLQLFPPWSSESQTLDVFISTGLVPNLFLRICFPLSQVSPTSLEENNGPTTNSKQGHRLEKRKPIFNKISTFFLQLSLYFTLDSQHCCNNYGLRWECCNDLPIFPLT